MTATTTLELPVVTAQAELALMAAKSHALLVLDEAVVDASAWR